MDCKIAIEFATTLPNNPVFNFNSLITTRTVENYNSFFKVLDEVYCYLTTCAIRNPGCGPYSGSRITISGITPFAISMPQNVVEGWTETICIECSNGQQTEQYDNFIVTQIRDCSTAITVVIPAPSNSLLNYNSVTTT